MIRVVIPGVPVAKNRPRFSRRGDYVHTYSNQRAEEKRIQDVMWAAIQGSEMFKKGVPLTLECNFYMPIPKYLKVKEGFHAKKPDVDNLLKMVLDSANGILWHDDAQISTIMTAKIYAVEPRTEIVVATTDDDLEEDGREGRCLEKQK